VGGGEGLISGGSFPLHKWFSLYLEEILRLKMRDVASENAAPEGMWVQGRGIKLLAVRRVFRLPFT